MPGTTSVDGIISGLNTTDIVQKLIEVESRPVELLKNNKGIKNDKIDEWRKLNTKLLALNTTVRKLRNFSNFSQKDVSVSDETKLSATVGSSASEGSYSVKVSQLATNHQIVSKASFASETSTLGDNLGGKSSVFDIFLESGESKTIMLSGENQTLTGLRDQINNAKFGIKASIVKVDDSDEPYKLYLASTNTGSENKFTIQQREGYGGLYKNFGDVVQEGRDAKIELGGQEGGNPINITSSTNKISGSIPGISITLKEVSTSPVTLNISSSNTGAEDMINTFADEYNEVIDFFKTQFSIDPLTQKGGLLMGDSTLMNIQRDLRFNISNSYSSLSGSITSLRQIGITSNNDGKLEVDSGALKSALIDSGKDLRDFFVTGVGAKIGTILSDTTLPLVGTIHGKTRTLERQVENIDESINKSEKMLAKRKEALFQKFTKMEIAIGRLQNQGNFLTQQMSSLSTGSKK